MRTLDQILTKKDYSRKTPASLFYKDSPLWQKLLTIGCVVFLAGAGLGEWKPINSAVGGLPKAISLGVIGLAMLYTLFYPNEKRLRELWKPTLLYMSLMAALFFWSMVIWIESFAAVSSMIRSCSKIVFQSIAILTAVALVYLSGKSHRAVYHQHLHCQHGHHATEHSWLRFCSQHPVSRYLSDHLR